MSPFYGKELDMHHPRAHFEPGLERRHVGVQVSDAPIGHIGAEGVRPVGAVQLDAGPRAIDMRKVDQQRAVDIVGVVLRTR